MNKANKTNFGLSDVGGRLGVRELSFYFLFYKLQPNVKKNWLANESLVSLTPVAKVEQRLKIFGKS